MRRHLLVALTLALPMTIAAQDLATAEPTVGEAGVATEGGTEAAAPGGIKLAWIGFPPKAPRQVFVEWGAKGTEVEKLLGESCSAGNWSGSKDCAVGLTTRDGWFADFGDKVRRRTSISFVDGSFYQYQISFDPSDFAAIERGLIAALGAPEKADSSKIKNAMGTEFDQEQRLWHPGDVGVSLLKRADTATEGMLSVVYYPLASRVPEKILAAPF